jgi:hypothetical protein
MLDFLKNVIDFILLTVFVKIIVGHWLAELILKWSTKFFQSAERDVRAKAIWQHFQDRARGAGHAASDILQCKEGNCAIL